MPSNIDATKPVTGNPTTQSMRDNFAAAKTEIEALQTSATTMQGTLTTVQSTANSVQSTMNLTSGSSSLARVGGDLGGMASSPTVTRLYGRNVSATAPTTGQPLIWNGTAWAPGSAGAVGNYVPM